MEIAVQISKENIDNHLGGPFGCVIVKENKIISTGANSVVKNNDPTAHAEVMAVRKACEELKTFDLSGCKLYTSCEPCPMCYGAIRWARIHEIYYANTRQDAHNINFSDNEIYDEIINNKQKLIKLDNKEAIKVFYQWKNDQNNVLY
jgi:guanine deaminase